MKLTEEQYQTIENLSGINYSPREIAIYLGIDINDFIREFNDESSEVRYHHDRGVLITKADIDLSNLQVAKGGNITAIQTQKKSSRINYLENFKHNLLQGFDRQHPSNKVLPEHTVTDNINLNYEVLQHFIETGACDVIPDHISLYLEQLDMVRSMYAKYESKSFIINTLLLVYKDLSRYNANKIFNDALNFFYLDNDVKQDAWRNIYAEKLENAALLAWEKNDLEAYRRLISDAAKIRLSKVEPTQIPDELLDRRPVFYTIKASDVGIEEIPRNQLAEFIDKLEITEQEKEKVKNDARVSDFLLFDEAEIIPEDDSEN